MKFDSTLLVNIKDEKAPKRVEEEIRKADLDLLDKINKTNDAIPTGLSTTFKVGQTSYNYGRAYSYTPQTQGFGTITLASAFWVRRFLSPMLFGMVKFAAGTTTATEARIYLPVLDNTTQLLSDSTLIPSIMMVPGMWNNASASYAGTVPIVFIESGVGYITLGFLGGGAGLSKGNADTLIAAGQIMSVWFELPISGWNA